MVFDEDINLEKACKLELYNMLLDWKEILDEAEDEAKLSAHIRLQLKLFESYKTETKIIHSLDLSEFNEPDDPNYLPFEGKDLGTITYELYVQGKTKLDSDKIGQYKLDEKKGLYLTEPKQVLTMWNEIINVAKEFESRKIGKTNITYRVSIRNLDYFEKLILVKVLPNKQPIVGKFFPHLKGTYHSRCEISQKLRDNGLEQYFV